MLFRRMLLLLAAVLAPPIAQATAQTPASPDLPAFAAATIKPPDPGAPYQKLGFYGEAGGRIFFGGNLKIYAHEQILQRVRAVPCFDQIRWIAVQERLSSS